MFMNSFCIIFPPAAIYGYNTKQLKITINFPFSFFDVLSRCYHRRSLTFSPSLAPSHISTFFIVYAFLFFNSIVGFAIFFWVVYFRLHYKVNVSWKLLKFSFLFAQRNWSETLKSFYHFSSYFVWSLIRLKWVIARDIIWLVIFILLWMSIKSCRGNWSSQCWWNLVECLTFWFLLCCHFTSMTMLAPHDDVMLFPRKTISSFQFNFFLLYPLSLSIFYRNSNKKEWLWYQIATPWASQIVRLQIQISW